MIGVDLSQLKNRTLVFYLSVEEYLARNIIKFRKDNEPAEFFFIWHVSPTVLLGRNQVLEAEVNVDYCKQNNIQILRRKSGGGCIYGDQGTIFLSYISENMEVSSNFERHLSRLEKLLISLGLDAKYSGRNDVLVGSKKVSGNAFFMLPKSSIIHGTLLFDTNFEAMVNSITPSEQKIKSKGVESVRQRVTNLKEEFVRIENHKYQDIEELNKYILESYTDNYIRLSEEDVKEIEKIEKEYLSSDFISGRLHKYALEKKTKVEGVGEIVLSLDMDADIIKSIQIKGDFFAIKQDLELILNNLLRNKVLEKDSLQQSLKDFKAEEYIMNLTNNQLINIILQ